MTDAEYEALKSKLERMALEWSERIGLGWWKLKFIWCREGINDPDLPHAAAATDVRWQYLEAKIRFDMPLLADKDHFEDDAALEMLVIHELTHVLVNELRCGECQHDEKKDVMHHEERVVTTVAKAFRWTYEAGQHSPVVAEEEVAEGVCANSTGI